jgi:hypothetical protein
MSGTAKFSAGSGMVSGSGHGGWVSGPRRPLVRAWRWVGRSVRQTGRGIALDASGPAQPSGGRASGRLDFPFAITAEMKGDLISRIGEFYDTRTLVP